MIVFFAIIIIASGKKHQQKGVANLTRQSIESLLLSLLTRAIGVKAGSQYDARMTQCKDVILKHLISIPASLIEHPSNSHVPVCATKLDRNVSPSVI